MLVCEGTNNNKKARIALIFKIYRKIFKMFKNIKKIPSNIQVPTVHAIFWIDAPLAFRPHLNVAICNGVEAVKFWTFLHLHYLIYS